MSGAHRSCTHEQSHALPGPVDRLTGEGRGGLVPGDALGTVIGIVCDDPVRGRLIEAGFSTELTDDQLADMCVVAGDGRDEGVPVLAVDTLNAGLHQRVILSTDGSKTREIVGDPRSPLRNHIVGIIDEPETR